MFINMFLPSQHTQLNVITCVNMIFFYDLKQMFVAAEPQFFFYCGSTEINLGKERSSLFLAASSQTEMS